MPNSLLGLLSQIPERDPEIPAAGEAPADIAEGAGRARRKRR